MREIEFNRLQSELDVFKFSSMKYVDYEEIDTYEVKLENANIILIYGYNNEAKINEYHWATNRVEYLIEALQNEKEFLITFIPHEWVSSLENIGFQTRNAWQDYFLDNMDNINASEEFNLLHIERCDEASKVTMTCKNQSRGFTGQTTEWVKGWITNNKVSPNSGDIRNKSVIIEKGVNDEIIGVLCVAIYSHENQGGPIVWIREIAVNPIFQNKGIGRKLILKALSYGKKYNAKRAFLTADEFNAQGINLYTSIGFKASGEESQIDMIGSVLSEC